MKVEGRTCGEGGEIFATFRGALNKGGYEGVVVTSISLRTGKELLGDTDENESIQVTLVPFNLRHPDQAVQADNELHLNLQVLGGPTTISVQPPERLIRELGDETLKNIFVAPPAKISIVVDLPNHDLRRVDIDLKK